MGGGMRRGARCMERVERVQREFGVRIAPMEPQGLTLVLSTACSQKGWRAHPLKTGGCLGGSFLAGVVIRCRRVSWRAAAARRRGGKLSKRRPPALSRKGRQASLPHSSGQEGLEGRATTPVRPPALRLTGCACAWCTCK